MKHQRLIIGSILILLLFSLMLYYSLDYNNHDPDFNYILDHFEQFNMTKVTLVGEVQKVDRTNNTLRMKSANHTRVIKVITTEKLNTTQPVITSRCMGLSPDKTSMTAEKLLITERWKNDLIYLRSLPAIPFVLYLFFRTYRFNPDKSSF